MCELGLHKQPSSDPACSSDITGCEASLSLFLVLSLFKCGLELHWFSIMVLLSTGAGGMPEGAPRCCNDWWWIHRVFSGWGPGNSPLVTLKKVQHNTGCAAGVE